MNNANKYRHTLIGRIISDRIAIIRFFENGFVVKADSSQDLASCNTLHCKAREY